MSSRVALIDDHELLAQTVSAGLESAGIRCVTIPPQPAEVLMPLLIAESPTLVLLDLDLGDYGDATPLIAPLTDAGIRVLVLTGQTDRLRLAAALEQGAVGLQSKASGFPELIQAITDAVTTIGVRRDPRAIALLRELAAHRAHEAHALRPFEQLTERERETLRELARGRTVKQIADTWVVSQATVRSHVRAILHKLDARSQLQAVVRAVHSGWINPDDDSLSRA